MESFFEDVAKSFKKKKNIILDYEIYEEDKLFKAELCITQFQNKYYVTYSFFLKDYEEVVDLYETYIHKEFLSIDTVYEYLKNEKK